MQKKLLKKIRYMILFFVVALLLSGITAFPVYTELKWLTQSGFLNNQSFFSSWLNKVYNGVSSVNQSFPFLFYGYDWLAFAHIIIAALFYGVYKSPVKNKFIISWGMFCCLAVIPLAFICGPLRGIPWQHILVDCSFGIIGIIPLSICKKWINQLEKQAVH